MSQRETTDPDFNARSAVAYPIPRAPPVMTVARPARSSRFITRPLRLCSTIASLYAFQSDTIFGSHGELNGQAMIAYDITRAAAQRCAATLVSWPFPVLFAEIFVSRCRGATTAT